MGASCKPCQYQMMVLHQISENYSHDTLQIISIDVWISLGETPEYLQGLIDAFKTQLGIDLDWTFGVDDETGTLFNKYASEGVPMLYILDKNGNIYYTFSGYTPYSEITKKLDELIK